MKAKAIRKDGHVQGNRRWPARASHPLEVDLHGVEGHDEVTGRHVEYRFTQVLIAVSDIV